jgi:twitching motility protein PilT
MWQRPLRTSLGCRRRTLWARSGRDETRNAPTGPVSLARTRLVVHDAVRMAAIDGLLALVELQKASGLELATGEVPATLVGTARRALSMPALTPATFDALIEEVLDPQQRARLRGQITVELVYRSKRSDRPFNVTAQSTGEGTVLRFVAADGLAPSGMPAPVTAASTGGPTSRRASALESLVADALDRGASDVILSEGRSPRLRFGGQLENEDGPVTTAPEIEDFLAAHMTSATRSRFDETGSADLACTLDSGGELRRFRANLFRHHGGLCLALRAIRDRIPTFEELGLPRSFAALGALHDGMVLLNGPAGSGKSTTLAALVGEINRTRAAHVITLEDPIEYLHSPRQSLIHQREIGAHVDGFGSGLRAALRESPDVILVGEMRDLETISLALTAAETGHLVLSTLHSGAGAMAIDRIIDVFPEVQQAQVRTQLASVLRAIVTQRLLPAREPGQRVPAVEVLRGSYAVAAQIREGKTHQLATQIQLGKDDGMIPLERSLVDLVRAGRITRETALAAARSPEELQRWLLE